MLDNLKVNIRRDNLYEQVASEIEKMIIKEELNHGDKLPAERYLGEKLKVSRTVVREAVKVLKDRKLVDVKPGSGTYVSVQTSSAASESMGRYLKMQGVENSYRNLYEVRLALEVEIAGMAADRARREDIEGLETILNMMTDSQADEDQFVKADLEFHLALAKATGNGLFNILMTPIQDLLLDFRLTAFHMNKIGSIHGAKTYHYEILECIRNRDSVGAREAMRKHLKQGKEIVDTYK